MNVDCGSIPFHRMDGSVATLADFRGQVLLLVNVASQCGLTPQYGGLEALYQRYRAEGLTVIGFPANDFGAQEPGSNADIVQFCSLNYGVAFPLAQKISVKGPGQHRLYAALTAALPTAVDPGQGALRSKLDGYGFAHAAPSDVLWNFEKFLIGRDGAPLARFNPDVAPDDRLLVDAIARALAA